MFIPKLKNDRKSEFAFENTIFVPHPMKKLATLSLLAIFIFNTFGYYIVFQISQYSIKKEVKSQIRQSLKTTDYTIITISKNKLKDVDFIDSGKEMFYKNDLYDIICQKETGTSVIFYCISDIKEKTLFAGLNKHIQTYISADPVKKSHSKKITDHLIKIYFSEPFQITYSQIDLSKKLFDFTSINYLSEFLEINSPPPELG